NLGIHTGTTVETVFNAQPLITKQPKVDGLRLVNITIDGDELQYFCTGVGGDYGIGSGNTAVVGDFDLITGDVEPEGPDLTNYQLKPVEGPFVNGDKTKLDSLNKLDVISLVISAPDTDIDVADTIIDFAAPY